MMTDAGHPSHAGPRRCDALYAGPLFLLHLGFHSPKLLPDHVKPHLGPLQSLDARHEAWVPQSVAPPAGSLRPHEPNIAMAVCASKSKLFTANAPQSRLPQPEPCMHNRHPLALAESPPPGPPPSRRSDRMLRMRMQRFSSWLASGQQVISATRSPVRPW
jgi:hypothetical protein